MRIQPKKRLGQNFLIDKNIRRKIIRSLQLAPSDIVVEIGAGRGELTALLAGEAKKVYALEIDPCLCQSLKDNLAGYSNIEVINRDALKYSFRGAKVKVAGNIPYYISTPLIVRLLRFRKKISAVFLTLQKEFAARLTAQAGSKEYGAFSCFVQYYARPKALFSVSKNCFFPVPKVDSCFLRMEMKEKLIFSGKKEKLFFRIIRAAFNQRRKTLRNSLKGVIPPQKLEGFFSRHNIDENIRPEDLSIEDFARLTDSISAA